MAIETFRPGMAPAIYRRLREQGRLAPEGVAYVTSWVDLEFRRCFQVMEAEGPALIEQWTSRWSDLAEIEIVPVRTSEQAAAAIASEA